MSSSDPSLSWLDPTSSNYLGGALGTSGTGAAEDLLGAGASTVTGAINTVQTIAWIAAGLGVALVAWWVVDAAKSPGGVSGRASSYARRAAPYAKRGAALLLA